MSSGSGTVNRFRRLVDSCLRQTGCEAEIRSGEPMSAHTTFKVGGPADCWVQPAGDAFPLFAAALVSAVRAEGAPLFILGGGANIVVADNGIRGIVLDTTRWTGEAELQASSEDGVYMSFRSGTSMDAASERAADSGLSGLEFLAGMPGCIGGGVWMNARCYEREIADVLVKTEALSWEGGLPRTLRIPADKAAFGYKRSPFQGRTCLILSAVFALKRGCERTIRAEMTAHRENRRAKGHYCHPSAGSVFKNNRDFGKPTGQIIDELGLKGLRIGGAQVAPFHANFIINSGGAAAADIRALTNDVAARVQSARGLILEPEILFVGDWE